MNDLLPPNATPAERALSEATARIGAVPVEIRDIWSPENCPENLLPWLADAFSVDQWDQNWTEAQKRAFIKASVSVHRRKGTIGAIREALEALSLSVQIQEWFAQETPGAPFTFKGIVEIDQVGFDFANFAALLEILSRVKNVRSHLSSLEIRMKSRSIAYVAAVPGVGSEISLTRYVSSGEVVLNAFALPV
jgi:phage tail P2-like protein